MSKTVKYRSDKNFVDHQNNYSQHYRTHKKEKKLKNVLRSKNLNELLTIPRV